MFAAVFLYGVFFVPVLSLWTVKCWSRSETALCREILTGHCPLNSVSKCSCSSAILDNFGVTKQAHKIWPIIAKNVELYKIIPCSDTKVALLFMTEDVVELFILHFNQ